MTARTILFWKHAVSFCDRPWKILYSYEHLGHLSLIQSKQSIRWIISDDNDSLGSHVSVILISGPVLLDRLTI